MVDLERQAAGVSFRLWVLVANLVANVLMVHGAVHYVLRGTHFTEMGAGLVVTGVCIALLSIPSR
jgi:hypothetical protein